MHLTVNIHLTTPPYLPQWPRSVLDPLPQLCGKTTERTHVRRCFKSVLQVHGVPDVCSRCGWRYTGHALDDTTVSSCASMFGEQQLVHYSSAPSEHCQVALLPCNNTSPTLSCTPFDCWPLDKRIVPHFSTTAAGSSNKTTEHHSKHATSSQVYQHASGCYTSCGGTNHTLPHLGFTATHCGHLDLNNLIPEPQTLLQQTHQKPRKYTHITTRPSNYSYTSGGSTEQLQESNTPWLWQPPQCTRSWQPTLARFFLLTVLEQTSLVSYTTHHTTQHCTGFWLA